MKWKEEFERQEKSRFVKKSGSRVRDEGVRVAYYYCSRSGSYVSCSRGIKSSKKKGTSKSSHHCTASLTCIEMPDGKVEVKVCSTHYGHDSNLQHLRLTLSEKYQIAEQLNLGVPREVILDNLRSSASSDIEKIHLINLKDIKNIEKAFGIQAVSHEKSTDMYSNLKTWVSSMQSTEHCPILYYDEGGTSHTNSYDVTISLLTTGQIDMLNKFGNGGIFYVARYSTSNKISWNNQSNRPVELYVTTLMLIDDMNEAIPVSFMVTNKNNPRKYLKFFESLKAKVPDISANALFTDDEKDVYTLWCLVFKEEPRHLWSNRFVDSDWRDNLVSIPDEDVQVSIYEKLYSYLESTDKDMLENSLDRYANELQANPMTNSFGVYFTSRYVNFQKFWAGCYGKQHIGINAQLNMELLFNKIAEFGLKRHFDRNLFVRVIQKLLKLFSENQCVRHSKLQRQIQDLSTHHILGMGVKPESIIQESDSSWRVKSVKDPENIFSIVNQQYSDCETSKCISFCLKCNTCVHKFHCTCRVYSYDRTMCKHIHAIAFTLNLFPKLEPSPDPEDIPITDHPETKGCSEIQISNEKLRVWQKELWKPRAGKRKRGRKPLPQKTVVVEHSLLPIVKKKVNSNIIKRKRGRPRNNAKENTANEEEVKKLVESILNSNEPKEVEKKKVPKKRKSKSKMSPKKKVRVDNASATSKGKKQKVLNKSKLLSV